MEDILPGEIEKWQWIEERVRIFFESQGFKEIRTPILEYTELFSRSVGESSDIVSKEMFSFQDRGERNITLRPEMTASVARSVIEKGLLSQSKSLRFYYIGPMFRAERPQAGRKRQFHQIGIEIVNESGADADFECMRLLNDFLKFAGVVKPILRVNDLGDTSSRKEMLQGLKDYFQGQISKLCKDCQWRLEKNVLRIFDCKVESCQPVIQAVDWDKLSPLSSQFKEFTERLKSHDILFEIKRRLVRGLDYYTGVVFEATAEGLGAQDALAGGGRYDGLYPELGGKETPCTGFSIGFERLLSVLSAQPIPLETKLAGETIYFAPLSSDTEAETREIQKTVMGAIRKLRSLGFHAMLGRSSSKLGDHLKNANKFGYRYVVILGSSELAKKEWQIKDMKENKQDTISFYDPAKNSKGLFTYFQERKGCELV